MISTMHTPLQPIIAGVGVSDSPLFSSLLSTDPQQEFRSPLIGMPMASSASFDWSDFPVVYQYNEDIPIPKVPSSPDASSSSCDASTFASSSFRLDLCFEDEPAAVLPLMAAVASTPTAAPKKKKNLHKKHVSFSDTLEIRSHPVILGDHPCSSGMALELGWEHFDSEVIDFALYENCRIPQRRHLHELRLSYAERRRRLEKATGLSDEDLLRQEQLAWREQGCDVAPKVPTRSCSCGQAAESVLIMRKVPSCQCLSSPSA